MSNISSEECYRRLGLKINAPWPEVKSAFRRKARLYHPDVSRNIDPIEFEMISEAYMILRSSVRDGTFLNDSKTGDRGAKKDLSWMKNSYAAAKAWVFDVTGDIGKKRKKRREEKEKRCEKKKKQRTFAVDSIIADEEVNLDGVISKVGRPGGPSERERFLKRLESRLPEVRNLAIHRLTPSLNSSEVVSSLEKSFLRYGIDETGLDIILSVSRDLMTDLRFARAIAPHFTEMSSGGAKKYVRWISRLSGAHSVYAQLEDHPSSEVMGFLFSRWPSAMDLPSTRRIISILYKNEEMTLIPLLRLISKKPCPDSLLSVITNIYQKSDSPSIKAWAGAIVCKSTVV